MRIKNFKNCISILTILNYRSWLDASPPLNFRNVKHFYAAEGEKQGTLMNDGNKIKPFGTKLNHSWKVVCC